MAIFYQVSSAAGWAEFSRMFLIDRLKTSLAWLPHFPHPVAMPNWEQSSFIEQAPSETALESCFSVTFLQMQMYISRPLMMFLEHEVRL